MEGGERAEKGLVGRTVLAEKRMASKDPRRFEYRGPPNNFHSF